MTKDVELKIHEVKLKIQLTLVAQATVKFQLVRAKFQLIFNTLLLIFKKEPFLSSKGYGIVTGEVIQVIFNQPQSRITSLKSFKFNQAIVVHKVQPSPLIIKY
jgi:hypothetical protein